MSPFSPITTPTSKAWVRGTEADVDGIRDTHGAWPLTHTTALVAPDDAGGGGPIDPLTLPWLHAWASFGPALGAVEGGQVTNWPAEIGGVDLPALAPAIPADVVATLGGGLALVTHMDSGWRTGTGLLAPIPPPWTLCYIGQCDTGGTYLVDASGSAGSMAITGDGIPAPYTWKWRGGGTAYTGPPGVQGRMATVFGYCAGDSSPNGADIDVDGAVVSGASGGIGTDMAQGIRVLSGNEGIAVVFVGVMAGRIDEATRAGLRAFTQGYRTD